MDKEKHPSYSTGVLWPQVDGLVSTYARVSAKIPKLARLSEIS
jgi:hypothetical protein